MRHNYTISTERNTMSNGGILSVYFNAFSSKSECETNSVNNYKQSCSIDFQHCSFTGKEPRKGKRIPLNKIKYNEQRDEETGYGYFGARYMDFELLTMFISVDRYVEKYPFISPYAYCLWNPLKLIDPTGDSAWAIVNNWNDHYISQYEECVGKISREYRERGVKYTCEDFALSVLIDFASENGLPITISNETDIYDARSAEYSDVASFKKEVLKTTGALDLQSSRNTLPVDCPRTGDLIVNCRSNGQGHHIQLIAGGVDANFIVYQGSSTFLNSIPGSSRLLGASNPASIFYAGQNIRLAVFDMASDYYVNATTGASYKNYSTTKNIEYRRWNYGGF